MKSLVDWLNTGKAPVWLDLIRIPVGGFLVYKGVIFALDFESFQVSIQTMGWSYIAAHFALVIVFVHIVCGSLLALGASTKWMSLLNLPIIIGAVVFNYEQTLMGDHELPITVGLLALLLLFLFTGSGSISLDQVRRNRLARH